MNLGQLSSDLPLHILANVFSSVNEEVVFRGGIVHATTQIWGLAAGLGAGSLPFGILHLVGILFGQSVSVSQMLGISLAGLMLSLVYFRFGLLGAVACHLAWNSFVQGWMAVYGIGGNEAVSAFEGSWVTCVVLIVSCAALAGPVVSRGCRLCLRRVSLS